MGDNKLGGEFGLERGHAQGDTGTLSPYIFNLCFQILILKLTFDNEIEAALPHVLWGPEDDPPGGPGKIGTGPGKCLLSRTT